MICPICNSDTVEIRKEFGHIFNLPFAVEGSHHYCSNIEHSEDPYYRTWMDQSDEDFLDLNIYKAAKDHNIRNKTIERIEAKLLKRKLI